MRRLLLACATKSSGAPGWHLFVQGVASPIAPASPTEAGPVPSLSGRRVREEAGNKLTGDL